MIPAIITNIAIRIYIKNDVFNTYDCGSGVFLQILSLIPVFNLFISIYSISVTLDCISNNRTLNGKARINEMVSDLLFGKHKKGDSKNE